MSHEGPITDEEYMDFNFLWSHFRGDEEGDAPPAAEMAAIPEDILHKEWLESIRSMRTMKNRHAALQTEVIRRDNIQSITWRKNEP